MTKSTFADEKSARSLIVTWGKELYDCGMVKGSGGNISIKLEDCILFTPSGYFLGHLTEECISKTDLEGKIIDGIHPTKEVPMHLAAYAANPDTNAIVHTHSKYAIALASTLPTEAYMPIYLPSVAAKVGNVKITPYQTPGSSELANTVTDGIANATAVLLSNHGIIAAGKTIDEAVSITYEIEENAQIHFITSGKCRQLSSQDLDNVLRKYV